MAHRHFEHDTVQLVIGSGRWPAGTVGTVVESSDAIALIEIADDHGGALDFVSLPHDALTTAGAKAFRATSERLKRARTTRTTH